MSVTVWFFVGFVAGECPDGTITCASLSSRGKASTKFTPIFSSDEGCIGSDQICDGVVDCPNGEDELKGVCNKDRAISGESDSRRREEFT
jgi:hypothetical protein